MVVAASASDSPAQPAPALYGLVLENGRVTILPSINSIPPSHSQFCQRQRLSALPDLFIICRNRARTPPRYFLLPPSAYQQPEIQSPWLLTNTIRRLPPTTRRLSLCTTSAATAVSLSTRWAISSGHAAKTLHSQRSETWRSKWAVTVRAETLLVTLGRLTLDAVDFDSFQKVLNRPGGFRDPGEPEEYCRGFQVFDKDMTGFIGVGQLRYILTNLGEKMSDEEVDELLKAVDTSSGEINYMELVRTILAN
jgi:hypothetical protein